MEYDNLCTQQNLDEDTLLDTLKERFKSGHIYTNSGLLLLLINPYKQLDIDSDAVVKLYKNNPSNLRPHIYALIETAIKDTALFGEHSIVISGESGSGKTECAKRMLQYLNVPAMHEVDTILEALGNAKTVNNDNSSRFGKLIRLHKNISVDTFLLEKSRVTSCSNKESNFHIFYYIMASRKESISNDYLTFKCKDSVDDSEPQIAWSDSEGSGTNSEQLSRKYESFKKALSTVGLDHLFIEKIIMGIVYLGSIKITEKGVERNHLFSKAVELLDFNGDKFEEYLLFKTLKINNENIRKNHSAKEGRILRDSISRLIYSRLFDYVVEKINLYLINVESKVDKINILDIFGFEDFENNGLDQFCINWCNEKIYDEFVTETFKTQKEILLSEGIILNNDLKQVASKESYEVQPSSENTKHNIEEGGPGLKNIYCNIKNLRMEDSIIPSIEKRCGIVDLISEESFLNGSAESLSIKLEKILKLKTKAHSILELDHFAGKVLYDLKDFLLKNKESGSLLGLSDNPLYYSAVANNGSQNIVGFFRNNLNLLFSLLKRTKIKYIKCIKPNAIKKPLHFDEDFVLRQLRASGILQSVELSKYLYPYSLFKDEFEDRYPFIRSHEDIEGLVLGNTMYFFNNKCYNILETWRENIKNVAVDTICSFSLAVKQKLDLRIDVASEAILEFLRVYRKKKVEEIEAKKLELELELKRKEILKIEAQIDENPEDMDEICSDEIKYKDKPEEADLFDFKQKSAENQQLDSFNANSFNVEQEHSKFCETSSLGYFNKETRFDYLNRSVDKEFDDDKSNSNFSISKNQAKHDRNNENSYKVSCDHQFINEEHKNVSVVNRYLSNHQTKNEGSSDQNVLFFKPQNHLEERNSFKGKSEPEALSKNPKDIIADLKRELSKYKSFSVSCVNCQILQQKYKIQSQQLQKKQSIELELEKCKNKLKKYEDVSSDSTVEEASVYNIFGCLIQLYLDYCPVYSNKDIPKDEILSLAHSILFVLNMFDESNFYENITVCLDEINKRLSDFEGNVSMVVFMLSNLIELKVVFRDKVSNLEMVRDGFDGKSGVDFYEDPDREKKSAIMNGIDSIISSFFNHLCNMQKKTLNDILPGCILEHQHLKEFRVKESIYKKLFSPPSISRLVDFLEYFYNLNVYFFIPDVFIMHNLSYLLSYIDCLCFNSMLAKKKFLNRNRCMQMAYNLTEIEKFCFNVSFHHGFYNMAYMREAIRVAMGISRTDDSVGCDIGSVVESSFLNYTQINTIIDLFEHNTLAKLSEDADNKKFIDEPKSIIPGVEMLKSTLKFVRPKYLPEKSLKSILRILKE